MSFALRRTGAWAGLAVVAADTAVEATLGLLATGGRVPPAAGAMEKFAELLRLAEAALADVGSPLDIGLRDKILRLHRSRNSAIHAGVVPPETVVTMAIDAARQVVAAAARTSPLLARISDAGPVAAVAEMVEVPLIRERLVTASDALKAGNLADAADNAALALDETLRRLDPPLRSSIGRRLPTGKLATVNPYQSGRFGSVGIDEIARPIEDRADLMEAWVLALAVGLRPNELRDLRRVVGIVEYYGSGPKVGRRPDVVLTAALVEGRLLTIASVVFRLVANGELRRRQPWESIDPASDA